MNAFVLKLIAVISMLFDHTGYLIFGKASFLNYIGRLALPIFAFQIAEGYTHTKNLKKYILRLFIFALISQIPFQIFNTIFFDRFMINVMFTLCFGLLSITIFDKYNKFLGILITALLAFIAEKLSFDYGAYGVIIILLFFIFKNNLYLKGATFILATFAHYFLAVIPYGIDTCIRVFTTINPIPIYAICTCVAILPILLYNGKKGRNIKYFLYLFYPIHLLIISALSLLLK